jgi:carbonic anhydrase/acetyltransferase-like protein (isoleucine patch superfamily)
MQLPYLDFLPALTAPFVLAPNAAVVGRTVAGAGLTMREFATARADGEWIRIGADAYFAERATVHIADSLLGATVGHEVTVGRFALVHACTVEDGVVVGDAAVVMDGAHVGARALITAGSLVPPRKRLAGGWLYEGNPATPSREIDAVELAAAAAAIRAGSKSQLTTSSDLPPFDVEPHSALHWSTLGAARRPSERDQFALGAAWRPHASHGQAPRIARAYIAPTASLAGNVSVADDASVFFGCVVMSGGARVAIGRRTNVQDNSLLVTTAGRGDIVIGASVTIGHNVRMGAAVIEDDALIGMGSELADGVVVEAGGCVGARAWVEAGTVVKAGWIWAGRPARAFRRVKPEEREWFAQGVAVYVRYAEAYRTGATRPV